MQTIFEVEHYISEYIIVLDTLMSAGLNNHTTDLLKSLVTVFMNQTNITYNNAEKLEEF